MLAKVFHQHIGFSPTYIFNQHLRQHKNSRLLLSAISKNKDRIQLYLWIFFVHNARIGVKYDVGWEQINNHILKIF